MVVLLNLVFRIGTSKRHSISLTPGSEDVDKIYDFMEDSGSQWGARREVVERATSALVECYEMLSGEELAEGPITVEATFDEFSLDLQVRYPGILPGKNDPQMNPQQLLLSGGNVAALASALLYRLADRVRMKASGSNCEVALHFEH
jgi:NCS2 family nucleobase:cation symporter-2